MFQNMLAIITFLSLSLGNHLLFVAFLAGGVASSPHTMPEVLSSNPGVNAKYLTNTTAGDMYI